MSMSRPYYDTCPGCGSHLDPGERCDCDKEDLGYDDKSI